LATTWNLDFIVRRAGVEDVSGSARIDVRNAVVQPPRLVQDHWHWPRLTITSYLLAPVSLILLVAGIAGVRRLPGLEPIAGGLVLTMTGLIAAGFMVQAIRSTVPVTAGADLTSPVANDPGAVVRGGATYAAYCLSCHGSSGEGVNIKNTIHAHGDSAGLVSKQTKSATDGDLYWWIGSGVAGTSMPAYDRALSDAERWDLVAYLRQLQESNGRTVDASNGEASP
jgi:mono/diheme cytochrome c family protein